MSKESSQRNISIEKLSLPKGGGSIKGISEKSQIREFDGSFSSSITLPFSACREITPDLSITYNSSAGNGIFGIGWNLEISKISLKTSKGTPKYDGNDNFLFDSQDLVPILNGNGTEVVKNVEYKVWKYYLRNESSFSSIKFYQNPDDIEQSFWKIIDNNHNVSIYGYNSLARICDQNKKTHISSWLLEEFYNSKGDHQIYYYKNEDAAGVSEENPCLNNTYISKISYGCTNYNGDSMILNSTLTEIKQFQWNFELVFDYGEYDISAANAAPYYPTKKWECRKDPFSSYDNGFEIRNYRKCLNILMFHNFIEIDRNPSLVTALNFEYQENYAQINQLVQVTSKGYEFDQLTSSYKSLSLPPSNFSYSSFAPEDGKFMPITTENSQNLTAFNEAKNYYFIDLFSEGISGILYNCDKATYYSRPELNNYIGYNASLEIAPLYDDSKIISEDGIKYQDWELLESFPNSKNIKLNDATGDGKIDLVVENNNVNGFFEANLDQTFSQFQTFTTFPTEYGQNQQKFVDITGNGLNDLFEIANDKIKIYPSAGIDGYDTAIIANITIKNFPKSLESSEKKLVDFIAIDGSGTSHLSVITSDKVIYFPNLGYGNFGEEVVIKNSPKFGNTFNSKNLFFADLDGSGTADMIYFESKKATIYFNYNGNSFSNPLTLNLPNDFYYDDLVKISFADINGRGNSCLIMSDSKNKSGNRHIYYDFCQGNKPYLLNKVDNNFGGITQIDYCSSIDFYAANKKANIETVTTPPFPVHLAYQITEFDNVAGSKFIKQYAYHDGYYDGFEREFRGFGRVDYQDAQYFSDKLEEYSPPHLNRNWYDIGIFDQDQAIANKFAKQYFQGDKDQEFKTIKNSFDSSISGDDLRLAYISTTNEPIRQEIYGLDNSELSQNPYSIVQNSYDIKLLQSKGNNLYGTFFVSDQREVTYNYERNPVDPLIKEDINIAFDDYGNEILSCEIFYPRRNVANALIEQQNLKIIASSDKYVNQVDSDDNYLIGVGIESKSYEINQLPEIPATGFTFEEISKAVNDAIISNQTTLVHWEQNLYSNNGNVLNFGSVAIPLLFARTNIAEFSNDSLPLVMSILSNEDLNKQLSDANYILDKTSQYWFGYDFTQQYNSSEEFFLPSGVLDCKNNLTSYEYDKYHLMLSKVSDPLNNVTTINNFNYLFLKGTKVTDINNNVSQVSLDILGRTVYTTYHGIQGEKMVGFGPNIVAAPDLSNVSIEDILSDISSYLKDMRSFFYYDDFAWINRKEPVQNLSILAPDYTTNGTTSNKPTISLSYIDGFAQEQQAKTKVEDGEAFSYDGQNISIIKNSTNRWLTSGYKIFNNKGDVVKEYEPYYFDSESYVSSNIISDYGNSFAFTSIASYDPLGRNYQTITAKGFLVKHEWSSWEESIFDENDTIKDSPYYKDNVEKINKDSPYYDELFQNSPALQSNLTDIATYFYNTPTTNINDNMNNVIIENRINCSKSNPTPVKLSTYNTYDILGRILTSCDSRIKSLGNCNNFSITYSLQQELYRTSQDSGKNWTLKNSFGNIIYSANSIVEQFISYDKLNRHIKTYAQFLEQNDPSATNRVVEMIVYGETLKTPEASNLRGKIYQHYDNSGINKFELYDITGNLISNCRTFWKDYKDQIDWYNDPVLEEASYKQSFVYDALARVTQKTDIDNNVTNFQYYQSSRISQLSVTCNDDQQSTTYFSNIIYNSKSQRESIDYGNNTSAQYIYDAKTNQVLSINTNAKSVSFLKKASKLIGDDLTVQNLQYLYDPVGNVIQKTDLSVKDVFYNSQKIVPNYDYEYDAIYQLIKADGCEQISSNLGNKGNSKLRNIFNNLIPSANNSNALENYSENYTYDNGGNLTQIKHSSSNSWTNNITISNDSNRGTNSSLNSDPSKVDQFFDDCGHQIKTGSANPLYWNYQGNIDRAIIIDRGNNNDTEYYIYDSSGKRVRKVLEQYQEDGNLSIIQTYYLGEIEIRQTISSTSSHQVKKEYHVLTISDGINDVATRILWKVGTPPSDFKQNIATFYNLSDFLNSQTTILDNLGNIVSKEEFSPYGNSTIFTGTGSAAQLKTRRYSNKEKDATGFYYYGMRYYSSSIGRWLSADPAGTIDGLNLYAFVNGNPVTFTDFNGLVKISKDVKRKYRARAAKIRSDKDRIASYTGRKTPGTRKRNIQQKAQARRAKALADLKRREKIHKAFRIGGRPRVQKDTIESLKRGGYAEGSYGHGRLLYLEGKLSDIATSARAGAGAALDSFDHASVEVDHSPHDGSQRAGERIADEALYKRVAVPLPRSWHRRHPTTRAGDHFKSGFSVSQKKLIADEGVNGYAKALANHLVKTFEVNIGFFGDKITNLVISHVQKAINYASGAIDVSLFAGHVANKSPLGEGHQLAANRALIIGAVNGAITHLETHSASIKRALTRLI